MDEFTLFPNLVVELRLKIWKFTMPGPRNVGIEVKIKDARFGAWSVRRNDAPPPVALQVYHESRQEALKHYILSFGNTIHPPTIYFNYQIDTLCFGDGINVQNQPSRNKSLSKYLLKLWHGKPHNPAIKAVHAKDIRFVALDVGIDLYGRPPLYWEVILLFNGLEELLLITWDSEEKMDELMAYLATTLTAAAEANPHWIVPKTEVVSTSGRAWGSLQPGASAQILSA